MRNLHIKGEQVVNLPNALSLYRLLVSPVILYMILTGSEQWFVVLICISLITDILDGNIARIFHLQTNFGAALDNLADVFTFVLALVGLFRFRWEAIQPHAWFLYLFLGIFILSYIVAFVRFRKIPGLHLYGAVIAGYLQGLFFFVLFAFDFYPGFYYVAIGWGIVAYLEKILVLLRLEDIRIGVKGLYWLLREDKR